jgi:predicted RNase H-like HicB family nuclease
MGASVVTLTVKLEAATRKDGKRWLAWCMPLDVMTQADSKPAALRSLKEAVGLWFDSCIDRGVLEHALEEAGFKRKKPGDKILRESGMVHIRRTQLKKVPSVRRDDRFVGKPDYIEISIPAYIASSWLARATA